jgi:CheY-like chemotaxis protein
LHTKGFNAPRACNDVPCVLCPCMASEPILIVDDNQLNLKLTRILLEKNGYLVRTAGDGNEALALLAEFNPRLILMDLQLPGMDGLEVTRRIKNNPSMSDIIVVALTAYAMKGDEEKARAAGCDGYITKPIDTRTLPTQIREYLEASSSN